MGLLATRRITFAIISFCILTVTTGSACAQTLPAVQGVLNGVSYSGNLAPGTWAAIFGSDLASATRSAETVPLPMELDGVSVTIGGIAAPLDQRAALQRSDLPGDRRCVQVQGVSQRVGAQRAEIFEHPHREVTGPVHAHIQRAAPAKRLEVADQFDQLELDSPDGVSTIWPVIHYANQLRRGMLTEIAV